MYHVLPHFANLLRTTEKKLIIFLWFVSNAGIVYWSKQGSFSNHLLKPRVKPGVIHGFLTFDYIDTTYVTIHWKAVEWYFTVVLFVLQFYPRVCNFGLSILDLAL